MFKLRFLFMTDEVFKFSHPAMRSYSTVHRIWQCEDFDTTPCVDASVQGLNLKLKEKCHLKSVVQLTVEIF